MGPRENQGLCGQLPLGQVKPGGVFQCGSPTQELGYTRVPWALTNKDRNVTRLLNDTQCQTSASCHACGAMSLR